MAKNLAPFVLNENSVKVSEFQTTAQGIISWQSLLDADTTSSDGMVLGLATTSCICQWPFSTTPA